jgi:haloacid dehalogenase superfamily, subfamily IA, variant 1 with third motif having Dx(3-4)D or Dx(3-4)E
MNFKGIIFDLDGTLVNSLEDLADSMNIVLGKFNYPVHGLAAYKIFIGNGILNLVRAALPEANRDEQTVAVCHDLMMEAYRNNCTRKTKPYDGIIPLLNELQLRGIKLGVFSNKADEFTKKIVQALMPGYFDEIIGLTSEAYKKPNPSGALQISKTTGILPENMAYVGDTNVDMQTASNAGMYGIGALWGFRTKEELIGSGAKGIIAHPAELLNII